MNKIYEELKKMHKYLYDKNCTEIGVSSFADFKLFDKFEKKENMEFIYNIKTRKLSFYGYNISGHNGDHYGCEYVEITDKNIKLETEKRLHNRYTNMCKEKAYRVALNKKKEQAKELLMAEQLDLDSLEFIK